MEKFKTKIDESKTKKNLGAFIFSLSTDVEFQEYIIENTKFLDTVYHGCSINQRFYHLFFEVLGVEKCSCGKPLVWNSRDKFSKEKSLNNYNKTCGDKDCLKKASSLKESCLKKYGVENISQTEEWNSKVKASNLEKFGTEWQTQSNNFKEKSKKTWQDKYGVDHHLSSEQSKKKKEKTNIQKYGGASPLCSNEVKRKVVKTCLDKYGETSPMKTNEIKNRVKATNIERYGSEWGLHTDKIKEKSKKFYLTNFGVEHNSQISDVIEKRNRKGYEWNKYVLPSGKTIKYQGYEHRYLDEFFKNGGNENNLCFTGNEISGEIGKIFYYTNDGKKHRYFPDFYIKSEKKVIEVKSKYTYEVDKEKNDLKRQAVLDMGLNFEFKIY